MRPVARFLDLKPIAQCDEAAPRLMRSRCAAALSIDPVAVSLTAASGSGVCGSARARSPLAPKDTSPACSATCTAAITATAVTASAICTRTLLGMLLVLNDGKRRDITRRSFLSDSEITMGTRLPRGLL